MRLSCKVQVGPACSAQRAKRVCLFHLTNHRTSFRPVSPLQLSRKFHLHFFFPDLLSSAPLTGPILPVKDNIAPRHICQ